MAFELGCLELQEGSIAGAGTVVAWAEGITGGGRAAPDLLHLKALIAELRGERRRAIVLYRRAIARSHEALTPLTHVLSIRNLASALAHERPLETAALYRRAIDLIHSERLEPSAEPGLRNGLGYALICAGDLPSARAELQRAHDLSVKADRPGVALFARFNQAIIAELEGHVSAANDQLEQVSAEAQSMDFSALANWCRLRQVWLLLKAKRRSDANKLLERARERCVSQQIDTVRTLDAFFVLIEGKASLAAADFHTLAETYRYRGDVVTACALLLWEAVSRTAAGSRKGAARVVREACSLRARASLRLSPTWWAREVTDEVARSEVSACSRTLHRVDDGIGGSSASVKVMAGARIWVDSHELTPDSWQLRTGARVLRRLFGLLVDARPHGATREALVDRLWPESEGDRATRNLYGAVKDLRRVLAGVPGLRIRSAGGRLSLEAEENVIFQIRGAMTQ
ncbi:MAG: hypothetical protein ACRDGT_02125 [Candidatus Limnocylindria bacterium]